MGPFFNTLRRIAPALACAALAAACTQPAGGQARRTGGPAVAIRTTTVQRMAIQRQVDLAGTLMSPDQARVSAEAAGIVRQVLVEIGREVRVGDPLVRLGPQEHSLALARAESALRQTRAQLGMHGPIDAADTPPPDDEIGSVKNAMANRDDAIATRDRAKTLSARGILSSVEMQAAETRLKVAEAAYQSAVDNVRGQKALLQDRRAAYDLAAKKPGLSRRSLLSTIASTAKVRIV